MDRALEGKAIIVTGGGSGIGRAAAIACAAAGARVVVADIGVAQGDATVSAIRQQDGEAIFVATDVADEAQAEALVAATVGRFGRLDGAFNNAGLAHTNVLLHELSATQWRRIQSVNYDGVFFCMKHEIRAMLQTGGGAIVNTSSALGRVAVPRSADYCGSKGGVLGLTKGAAVDYGHQNIRANAILPGAVDTPMVQALTSDPQFSDLLDKLRTSHPVGRIGLPEEVAAAAVWLLSDQSSFVTGAELAVDGGFLAT
ncbi:glucose 1-dehydrogenase [Paraburkholderia susongensis]|uniref:NAD(P)-dependent dehydrogenase, short-chain alcohol dehydrogenase family n=1 Tax=Paraburkholderia susongensis TaxID=1515439 RepID=A0A1X7J7Z9_9BURK|nr:glucose 1-dehydrogenase [Paraburkholderia susongensis]SMG23754.1 NAD(P)-dependent dehydrogenase, short-chain alcohol dehydrogenase family [Paraburkholderia susongensis]